MARHDSPHDERPDSDGTPGRRWFGGRGRPRRAEYTVADLLGQPAKDSATKPTRRVGMALGGLLAVGSITAVAVHIAPTVGLTHDRGTASSADSPTPPASGAETRPGTATPPGTSSAVPPLGALPPPSPGTRPPPALPNALPPKALTPGTGTSASVVGDPGLSPVDLLSAPRRPTTVPAFHPGTRSGHHPAVERSTHREEAASHNTDNRRRGLVGGLLHDVDSSAGAALSSLTGTLG